MKRCIIMGAGDFFPPLNLQQSDYIIAADGGQKHLNALGIQYDLAVGDFDSSLQPINIPSVTLQREKDTTDTQMAIQEGLKRGYSEFHIHGCLGDRNDHSQANIQCIAGLAKIKALGVLYGKDEIVLALSEGSSLAVIGEGIFSVLAFTDTATVTLMDAKYPLKDAVLQNACTFNPPSLLAVSNEIVGGKTAISASKGIVLVYLPRKNLYNIKIDKDK